MPSRFRTSINKPKEDLAKLRLTLERLERTGDLSSPSIADLRRILLERIAELEAAERFRAKYAKAL